MGHVVGQGRYVYNKRLGNNEMRWSRADAPGGPAEMVPGSHHCRMNMYIAVANSGKYEVVSRSEMVNPKER